MKKIYLFDLDSTITKGEILPTIAKKIGKEDEMKRLTEMCMTQDIPFDEGLKKRMGMLKDIPVSTIDETILDIPLNEKLVDFINKHKNECYIVSGSVDTFIKKLMKKMNMENNYFSSRATVKNDRIESIDFVIDKEEVAMDFINKKEYKVIAIGDGSNDAKMAKIADVGIAFGGVRKIAPSLLEAADYATYSEEELCELLEKM
ncbi:MAG: HAD family phosphatase [Clostridia bacterium]|nr:HAD family phosphatase [Bacilli bacterium]MBR3511479.1 HAD family phosphatase [Clostridia bacterium]